MEVEAIFAHVFSEHCKINIQLQYHLYVQKCIWPYSPIDIFRSRILSSVRLYLEMFPSDHLIL